MNLVELLCKKESLKKNLGNNLFKACSTSVLILAFIFVGVFGCSRSNSSDKTKSAVAVVNDYVITQDDFQYRLAKEIEYDPEFKLTNSAKKIFLDELVRKELLIQEAKKLKLDGKEKFIKAIERYWEATLIRDLIDSKCNEVDTIIVVGEEEILAHYEKLKLVKKDEIPPIDDIRKSISDELLEKKREEALELWEDELKKKAKIIIDEKILYNN